MRCCFLAFLAVLTAFPASAGQDTGPITAANWLRHPQIVDVRQIYEEIRTGIDGKRFKKEWTVYQDCTSRVDSARTVYRDRNGARYYYASGGSDDSRVDRNFYYDTKGVLRFVYITGGAVNGTAVQHRIYFDAAGKRIWEIQKRLAGPGYTFPRKWPEASIVRRPDKALYADHPCPVKAGG